MQEQERIRLASGALEKTRILNGRGQAAGEQHQNFLLLGREVIHLRALDIDDTDDLMLKQQRHGELGTNAIDGIDVTRIVTNVGHQDRLAARGRGSRNTLADRDAPILHHLLTVSDGEPIGEHLAPLIEQHDGKNFVVHQALDERGHLGENAVQVQ